MTEDQITKRLQDMTDAHHAALAAVLRGGDHADRAITSLQVAAEEMHQMISENRIAIQAALLANEAVSDVMAAWARTAERRTVNPKPETENGNPRT